MHGENVSYTHSNVHSRVYPVLIHHHPRGRHVKAVCNSALKRGHQGIFVPEKVAFARQYLSDNTDRGITVGTGVGNT